MNVYLDSIGCRLNQSEIEKIAEHFRLAGHQMTDDPALADVVVINTCTVTAQAASDSRGKVRAAHRAGADQIIVTGCWSAIDPDGAAILPGVHSVVPNHRKETLAADFLRLSPPAFAQLLDTTRARQALPGKLARTRAFIKAQDGCDNDCTYCITHLARGKARSTPLTAILRDVEAAERGGAQEVVLTGVQLACWGKDLQPRQTIKDLVAAVLRESSIARLRLSSLEPWDIEEDFFALFENQRLCPHLHLPLQSGSQAVLQRMARRVTPLEYQRLLTWARQAAPDIAITTDIIVGFPGESEQEFEASLAFVQEMQFSDGHVFSFSPREGTPAARFGGQIPSAIKKERNHRMRQLLNESKERYQQRFIGKKTEVLWEGAFPQQDQWLLSGLSPHYLRVKALSDSARHNQLDTVLLAESAGDHLRGALFNQSSS